MLYVQVNKFSLVSGRSRLCSRGENTTLGDGISSALGLPAALARMGPQVPAWGARGHLGQAVPQGLAAPQGHRAPGQGHRGVLGTARVRQPPALGVPSEGSDTGWREEILFGNCHGWPEPIFWEFRVKYPLFSWLELPGGQHRGWDPVFSTVPEGSSLWRAQKSQCGPAPLRVLSSSQPRDVPRRCPMGRDAPCPFPDPCSAPCRPPISSGRAGA